MYLAEKKILTEEQKQLYSGFSHLTPTTFEGMPDEITDEMLEECLKKSECYGSFFSSDEHIPSAVLDNEPNKEADDYFYSEEHESKKQYSDSIELMPDLPQIYTPLSQPDLQSKNDSEPDDDSGEDSDEDEEEPDEDEPPPLDDSVESAFTEICDEDSFEED